MDGSGFPCVQFTVQLSFLCGFVRCPSLHKKGFEMRIHQRDGCFVEPRGNFYHTAQIHIPILLCLKLSGYPSIICLSILHPPIHLTFLLKNLKPGFYRGALCLSARKTIKPSFFHLLFMSVHHTPTIVISSVHPSLSLLSSRASKGPMFLKEGWFRSPGGCEWIMDVCDRIVAALNAAASCSNLKHISVCFCLHACMFICSNTHTAESDHTHHDITFFSLITCGYIQYVQTPSSRD